MDVNTFIQSASVTLIAVAWKVAGALVLWLVGRWLISFAIRMLSRALSKQQFDVTLSRYLQTGLSVVLNIALLVAILALHITLAAKYWRAQTENLALRAEAGRGGGRGAAGACGAGHSRRIGGREGAAGPARRRRPAGPAVGAGRRPR